MFERLKQLLGEELQTDAEQEEDELRFALAALVFEVVWADHDIDARELDALKKGLIDGFGIDEERVEALAAHARERLGETTSIYPFTRLVMERSSEAERRELVTLLWQVALADDILDKYEEYTIRKIADLLYLSHADFIAAKREARRRRRAEG
ncbi:MAG: TerB family tellurite resistance protein [Gammaproteobacteria bacterium]|jgi:uncharacterized tellurite resistance protein B-like protein